MRNNNKNNNNSFFNNKNSFGMTSDNNENYAFNNIPMGLSMAFTQNPAALTAFQNMDDTKKKKVIQMASNVSSKKEMTELVQNISINNL